jgi:hypothetical protein
MMARIVWRRRESVRKIEKRARQTADPLDRLRYVRERMESREPLDRFQWWPAWRIAAVTAAVIVAAIGAVLLVRLIR